MPPHRARLVAGLALATAVCAVQPGEAAAQPIVERARQRHQTIDTTLTDYRSRLTTLVSVGLITDPLAPPQLVLASELAAAVAWDRRAGLQVRILGQRYVTSLRGDVDAELDFDEPWFVATAPGDSLRVLGGIELPARAAVHPFATDADRYYEYATGDSVTLLTSRGRVRLIEVEVTPLRGDEALVVGSFWLDEATGDVAAMQIRFVGKPLWAEDEQDEGSEWANRILSVSATLEYALWEGRYWLPRRQELELRVRVPFFGHLTIPVVFRNRFGRYRVNAGEPIAWLSPDSARARRDAEDDDGGATMTFRLGADSTRKAVDDMTVVEAGPSNGGWEIVRPPVDSLRVYEGWDRPLEAPASELTLPSAEELERRARQLAPDVVGRKTLALQVDRLAELIRYNRVEALGVGATFRWDLPRLPFWSLGAGAGFGLGDLEPKGRLGVRYDGPGAWFDLSGYSDLHRAGTALTDGDRSYGPALRPLLLGRDDADYYRASGARVIVGRRWGRLGLRVAAGFEDHASVRRHTHITLPDLWQDSVFALNPPVQAGEFGRAGLEARLYLGEWTRPVNRAVLTVGLDAGTGPGAFDYLQPVAGFQGRVGIGDLADLALRARAGWTAGHAPIQRAWRIGGLSTVRGYSHGVRRGDSFWTARLEGSRGRGVLEPVIFGDIGWAGGADDWPGQDLVGSAGVGLSVLSGLVRADLVFPESGDPWFELYFRGSL